MSTKGIDFFLRKLGWDRTKPLKHSKAYIAYEASRRINQPKAICHAPLNSMYFNVYGQVAPCWLSLDNEDTYPKKSLKEIWGGKKFQKLRKELAKGAFPSKCKVCQENIEKGNHVSVLAKLYDNAHPITAYPSIMEFELSNTCNLACVMCKGELSSTIRKIRDGLPPLKSPYDSNFISQLEEFIPHLKEAKFLGGEPFLIDLYYDIWDKMIELNPNIEITVTTNATAYNHKIERVLSRLKCHIIVSLDSFNKESYEAIRLRANFDKVKANLIKFRDYTREKKSYFGVSINPLRKNWHELSHYVDQCNEYGASLWFNTVIYPFEEALWSLSANELEEIYHTLSNQKPKEKLDHWDEHLYNNNLQKWENLVHVQIKNWMKEAKQREKEKAKMASSLKEAEFGKALLTNLEEYVNRDAYIAPGVKEKQIEQITQRVRKIEKDGEFTRLKELYLLPESESILGLAIK